MRRFQELSNCMSHQTFEKSEGADLLSSFSYVQKPTLQKRVQSPNATKGLRFQRPMTQALFSHRKSQMQPLINRQSFNTSVTSLKLQSPHSKNENIVEESPTFAQKKQSFFKKFEKKKPSELSENLQKLRDQYRKIRTNKSHNKT